jgi:hypothetical protein
MRPCTISAIIEQLPPEHHGKLGQVTVSIDPRQDFPLLRYQTKQRQLLRFDVDEGRNHVGVRNAIAKALSSSACCADATSSMSTAMRTGLGTARHRRA